MKYYSVPKNTYGREFIIIYRGECPILISPCRRAYRKVIMQQQGFVVCDVTGQESLEIAIVSDTHSSHICKLLCKYSRIKCLHIVFLKSL